MTMVMMIIIIIIIFIIIAVVVIIMLLIITVVLAIRQTDRRIDRHGHTLTDRQTAGRKRALPLRRLASGAEFQLVRAEDDEVEASKRCLHSCSACI